MHVLADNLGSLLSTERIYLYPRRLCGPIDCQEIAAVIQGAGKN
jgi:hypothetical protein